MTSTATDPRVERVRAAHAAALTALAAEEQAIRDAHAAGLPVAAIARDGLGTSNRQRVYAVLGRGPDDTDPRPPALTPIVYLRGAGRSDDTWARMERAMWARGWATTRSREDAWHAARGGVPVVHVDFSAGRDESGPAVPGGGIPYGYGRYVLVGRVRARYRETEDGRDHDLQLPHPMRHEYGAGPVDDGVVQAAALLVADALG